MLARPASRLLASSAILACLLGLAARNPAVAADVQPDRLNFGTIHAGAKVHGSVRIFVDPKLAKESKAKVDPPAFVTLAEVATGTQEFGQGNLRGYCDIEVTIDTAKPGDYSGPIRMSIGDRVVEVPVKASIRPRRAESARVLVADSPFEKFSTSDASLFDHWLKVVDAADLDVDYLLPRGGKSALAGADLTRYEVILLGQASLLGLGEKDVADLKRFAERGSRVVLAANAFYVGTVEKANELLIRYGLRIEDIESRGVDRFTLDAESITPCPMTEGVKSLFFHRPSPIKVTDAGRTMELARSKDREGGCFVAVALAGEGQIVALGESLWWDWVKDADNATLLANLLRKRPKGK